LLLWAILQRRWQVLIGFFATIAVMVLISLPFISNPSQLIGSGIEEHLITYLGVTSTIWAMFINWGTSWHVPFVISLGLLGWVAWTWLPYLAGKELSTDRVRFLISLAVVVNLLVIPYSWIYNLALLLLPFAYSFSKALKLQGWEKFAWITALFSSQHVLAFITIAIYGYEFDLEKSQWYHIVHALIFLGVMTALEYRTNPKAH
jgi:hypothetical protein